MESNKMYMPKQCLILRRISSYKSNCSEEQLAYNHFYDLFKGT